jgi:hypothetical protein
MTRVRLLVTTVVVACSLLVLPALADAQGRRAVRVVRPRTTAVFIGGYYNPFFYDPFYPRWYAPYAQWYPPYVGYGRGYDLSASMRLQVAPRETEVFIDGYYAGTVDDFDGVFQRLHLEPGDHDLVLYLEGHRSYEQKLYLQPGRTFGIRHSMEPLGTGEAAPPRPAGGALPSSGGARQAPNQPGARPAPSRPGERPADAQGEFGALALRVQPEDAEIVIDGERWEGSADGERLVVQLGPGAHTIEIRKDGYRSYITDVSIRSRETTTLNVAMTRQ